MKRSTSHGRSCSAVQFKVLGALATGFLLSVVVAGCAGDLPQPASNYAASGGAAGGNGGAGGAPVTLPPCDAPTMIFTKDVLMGGCLGSSCHTLFKPLLQNSAGLRDMLIAETALTSMNSCAMQKIVDPANPSASVLLRRVQGGDCGERMPSMSFGATAYLSQADIDCIAGWVANP